MKKISISAFVIVILSWAVMSQAQNASAISGPLAGQQWIRQFVGEWDVDSKITMAPGQRPLWTKGIDSVRVIGDFWIIAETNSTLMQSPITSVFTLGYDSQSKKFVGTWVDSMSDYLWKYQGTVDATGKILTLETEGPNPTAPGTFAKFREVIEFKSADRRVWTSSRQVEDGTWQVFSTSTYQRKAAGEPEGGTESVPEAGAESKPEGTQESESQAGEATQP